MGKGILSGYKTYILGGLAALTAIANYLVGDVDLAPALEALWQGLLATGLITLRAGVKKAE